MSGAPAAPAAPLSAEEVDAGWDDVLGSEDRDPIAGLRSDPAINYGDAGDDDVEAKPIELEPDLPKNPGADEIDPVTARDHAEDSTAKPVDLGKKVRNVVGVKFASAGKIYLFDGGDDSYQAGESIIVESDRGPRMATVADDAVRAANKQLKKILRRPDKNDYRAAERNEDKAREVLRAARERSRELRMAIKVFRAEYAHTGKRVRIYFTAEQRVDFRGLVQDLSRTLHTRVEMRQTGVRDQAKMVGGIGSCGRELCCTTWLPEFVPVSIKNAKDQGLVLNPTKVSGQCGRLKCCLVYEQALYSELRKGLPKMGKRVVTADGEGRVVEVDVLHQRIRVSLGHGEFKVYPATEVERMFPAQQPNQPGTSKKSRSRKPRRDAEKTGGDAQPPAEPAKPAASNDTIAATEPDSGESES